MTAIDDVFNSFFFGAGAWLGFLVFTLLILGVVFKWRITFVLMLPVTVFLAIAYLENGLGIHAILMFLESIFILGLSAKRYKE